VVVIATFLLIVAGGNVTSIGAGLSVPDWPRSLGSYNPQGWTRMPGVRDEHAHRLIGAGVGLLVTGAAIWVWVSDPRVWVKQLASLTWLTVVFQGILGGLRVTEKSLALAVVHGCIAQAFLCMTVALAAATSSRWPRTRPLVGGGAAERLRLWTLLLVLMAFVQLIVGAILRQTGWGVAASLHILGALVYGMFFIQAAGVVFRRPAEEGLGRPMVFLMIVYAVQVLLGVPTYLLLLNAGERTALSNVQQLLPTAHVAVGAVLLGTSFYLTMRSFALTGGLHRPAAAKAQPEATA